MNKNFRTYTLISIYGLCAGILFNIYTYCYFNAEQLMGERKRILTELLSLDIKEVLLYLTVRSDHMISYYLYQRFYGGLFGINDVVDIMQQIWVWMFVFVYSIITAFSWYKYRSKILTLCTPVFFYFFSKPVLVNYHDDCTWFLAWAIYAILPLLIILKDKYSELIQNERYAYILLAILLISVLIGISNVGRLHSGLATGCILLYVVMLICKKIRHKKKAFFIGITSLLIVCQGYTLFTTTIPNSMMRLYGINSNINYFGPWHTLYIGLGWRNSYPQLSALAECEDKEAWKIDKNPQNIIFKDGCADSFVKSKDSGIEYLSKPYFEVLKTEYIRILTENKQWVFINYLEKSLTCLIFIFYRQWKALLIVSVMLLILKRKAKCHLSDRFLYGSLIFAMCVDFIFGIIAMPTANYLQGSMAALSLAIFILVMDMLASLLCDRQDIFKRRELL